MGVERIGGRNSVRRKFLICGGGSIPTGVVKIRGGNSSRLKL